MTWARSSVPARCIEGNGVTHEVRSAITAVLSAALGAAISRTDLLVAELEEAFRKRTWAHRHESRGRLSVSGRGRTGTSPGAPI